MIAFLQATIKIHNGKLIALTNGVGYGIEVGPMTFNKLLDYPDPQVELFIHTFVREDQITLYGFLEPEQKELFLHFLNISGVGPKTALQITDQGVREVINAVQQADVTFFSSVPRVGKKLAQKIIIELKNKVGSLKDLDLTPETPAQTELAEALRSLSFAEQDIQKIIKQEEITQLPIEKALKHAIRQIGS